MESVCVEGVCGGGCVWKVCVEAVWRVCVEVCVEKGVCVRVCGGRCVTECVCVEEGMCGGCVWRRVCVKEDVCEGGCVEEGVWRRVCVEGECGGCVEGVCGRVCVEGVCGGCVWRRSVWRRGVRKSKAIRMCQNLEATANDLQSLVANKAEVSKGVAEVGAVPEKRRSEPKARPLGDQERGARVCSHCGQAHKSRQ